MKKWMFNHDTLNIAIRHMYIKLYSLHEQFDQTKGDWHLGQDGGVHYSQRHILFQYQTKWRQ